LSAHPGQARSPGIVGIDHHRIAPALCAGHHHGLPVDKLKALALPMVPFQEVLLCPAFRRSLTHV
jgi:hypothetical protein